MNKGAVVLSFGLITACNFDAGECYLRSEEGAGVGGSIIAPVGDGGFGAVPPETQDATDPPPPECNIATQSPCYQKCQADYEAAVIGCGGIANEAQRKTCEDTAYASYKSCREGCQQAANTDCDDKYQDCADNGSSGCLKKSGGKTLCQRCWERCNAGDSPSEECRKCKF